MALDVGKRNLGNQHVPGPSRLHRWRSYEVQQNLYEPNYMFILTTT